MARPATGSSAQNMCCGASSRWDIQRQWLWIHGGANILLSTTVLGIASVQSGAHRLSTLTRYRIAMRASSFCHAALLRANLSKAVGVHLLQGRRSRTPRMVRLQEGIPQAWISGSLYLDTAIRSFQVKNFCYQVEYVQEGNSCTSRAFSKLS